MSRRRGASIAPRVHPADPWRSDNTAYPCLVARRITEERRARNWTRRELARRSHLSEFRVWEVEDHRWEHKLDARSVRSVCRAMGLPVELMLERLVRRERCEEVNERRLYSAGSRACLSARGMTPIIRRLRDDLRLIEAEARRPPTLDQQIAEFRAHDDRRRARAGAARERRRSR